MSTFKSAALAGAVLIAGTLLSAPAVASPRGSAVRDALGTHNVGNSLLIEVQRPRRAGPVRAAPRRAPPPRRDRRGRDAAIAAGVIGLAIGGIIAAEAARQDRFDRCSRRPGFNANTMTFRGRDGRRYHCP